MNIYEKITFYIVVALVAFLGYLQYANSFDIQKSANAYNIGYKQGVKEIQQAILADAKDGSITLNKIEYKKITNEK